MPQQKVFTQAIMAQLIANFDAAQQCAEGADDPAPVVKVFTPDAQATWLLTEYDQGNGMLFGLCDLGHGCPELGYVSMRELLNLRGPMGLPVERDAHCKLDKPLSVYTAEARREQRIAA